MFTSIITINNVTNYLNIELISSVCYRKLDAVINGKEETIITMHNGDVYRTYEDMEAIINRISAMKSSWLDYARIGNG